MPRRSTASALAALAAAAFWAAGPARAQDTTAPSTPPPATTTPEPSTAAAEPTSAVAPPTAPTPDADAAVAQAPRRTVTEEVTVTGSRIRRKDLTTPAPITVITKEAITSGGRATLGDFLQRIPEQGAAINGQVNNGGDSSVRINLRGLGALRTLVLVNGRRYVPSGAGANTDVDISSIPTAAIERVEILKDGASAIYGSDAIGGVVNLITRRRFNGTEVSAYAGTSTHIDGTTFNLDFTSGVAGDKGAILLSGGWFKQNPVFSGARDFGVFQRFYDQTNNNGNTADGKAGEFLNVSSRTPQGAIVFPRGYKLGDGSAFADAIVTKYGAAGVFVRDPNDPVGYRPLNLQTDGYNFQPVNYLVTPSTRIQLFSTGEARLGNFARAYFEASYVNRQSSQQSAATPLVLGPGGNAVTVSKDNFYNPFGVDLTNVRRRLLEFGPRISIDDINTFRGVVGIDGTLPDEAGFLRGWFFDVSLNYGRNTEAGDQNGNLDASRIQNAVGPTFLDATGRPQCGTSAATQIPGCVPLDLFSGPNSIPKDQQTGLGFLGPFIGWNQQTSAQFNTNGELFRLFADRSVGLALGYEFRLLLGGAIPDPVTQFNNNTNGGGAATQGRYHVNEGYAELNIPIISNAPFAQDIEATAAIRVFDYSNFGSDYTYKFGGRWRIIPDITLRGTYSTSFRAPSVAELFTGLTESFPNVADPCSGAQGAPPKSCGAAANNGDIGTQQREILGGNPNLQPETAKTWTAGVVLEPTIAKGLSITADYYFVSIDNLITLVGAPNLLAGCYPADGSGKAPNALYCSTIRRDKDFLIDRIIDTSLNAGSLFQDGLDLSLRYALPTPVGRFGFAFDGTWLHRYNITNADGTLTKARGTFDAAIVGAGTGSVFPAFKFLTGVTWAYAGFGAGGSVRFTGSFRECGDVAGQGTYSGAGLCYVDNTFQRKVEANATLDLFASYAFQTNLGRTSLGVGVNNVLNQNPPNIYNGFTATTDPSAYDLVGRFFYARIAQSF